MNRKQRSLKGRAVQESQVRLMHLVLGFVLLLVCVAEPARADDKFELMTGFYSLSAKTTKKSGGASGPGVYRAAYSHPLRSDLEFSLGYSLFLSGVISGDMGYGPDLGINYFPISDTGSRRVVTDKVVIDIQDVYRPFVGIGFHQRQFQSVDSSYAGFSLNVGSEYHWSEGLNLKGLFRYQMLTGPAAASATQLDVMVGVIFSL